MPQDSVRKPTPAELRQNGMHAFKSRKYGKAIELWSKLDADDPAVKVALAEAHFRQAVVAGLDPQVLEHLEWATLLVPRDPLYTYGLGLILHKQGRLTEAMAAYQEAVANGLTQPGSGKVIALAALEMDPNADPATLPGVSLQDRQALEPALGLLRGDRQKTLALSPGSGNSEGRGQGSTAALQSAILGLGLLKTGNAPEARQVLGQLDHAKLSPEANAIRWHYLGVAAARSGDEAGAVAAWKQALRFGGGLGAASDNLVAAYAQQAAALAEKADWEVAAQSATEGLKLAPGQPALSALAIKALDRLAHSAAGKGDWSVAAGEWEEARRILAAVRNANTHRPLSHNLALAYEATQEWYLAAEAWRTMLRTRPRKKPVEGFTDDHWAYVRARVIACYKEAGQIDQVIAVSRQVLKASPDDADVQFDLANALAANEQWQAAINELERLVDRHPQYIQGMVRLAELYGEEYLWGAAENLLERALKIDPDNPQLRQHMAHILVQHADDTRNWGSPARVRALYEQALRYTPEDYHIHLDLAGVELDAQDPKRAREHVQQALEQGAGVPDMYEHVFGFWIEEEEFGEARKIVELAEVSGTMTADFYVQCGTICFREASAPPSGFPNLDALFKPDKARQSGAEKTKAELCALGQELFERALALEPDVGILRKMILGIGFDQPRIAIPYVRRLLERTPDDPMALMTLGILLGVDGQIQEAQQAFRDAEHLYRKAGDRAMTRQVRQMRELVAHPSFAAVIRTAPFWGHAFEGDD